MSQEFLELEDFRALFLSGRPILDVRAPIEFYEGSLPNSVNGPILDDSERALVGTVYKQQGNAAAVALGQSLVSGENREAKLQFWERQIHLEPSTVLTCFRGGQRSRIAQAWLAERNCFVPRLRGGTKLARTFLMGEINRFSQKYDFVLISGPTGSGKTHFLNDCRSFAATIDLEDLAHHKGSAFGKEDRPQPTQIDFENRMAQDLLRAEEKLLTSAKIFLVEDESRMIGSCVQPLEFFEKLRASPVIWLELSLDERVENIFHDYVTATPLGVRDEEGALRIFARYKEALRRIERKLGGLKKAEILADLESSERDFFARGELESQKIWIKKMLVHYYDPLYFSSLEKRNPAILFRGSRQDARQKLLEIA